MAESDAYDATTSAAMLIGIAIALMQALTQVQEMTLTFIPKIVVILLMVSSPRLI